MHTFEQFMLHERQRGEKLGLSPKQPKDQLYGHSAAKSFLDALRRSGEDLSNYGITMTELPKVGINPQSHHATPLGVYFYPGDYYYETIDMDDKLPFQHDAKYINILKFKSSSNILHLDDDVAKFEKFRLRLVEITPPRTKVKMIYRRYAKDDPPEQFWAVTRIIASAEGKASVIVAVQWNRLFAKLGIDIIIDSEGKGVIHSSEPNQGFLIDGTKATVIRRIESTPPRRVNHRSPEQLMLKISDDKDYKPTAKEITFLATSGRISLQYAWHSQKRFPEGEPAIIKDVSIDIDNIYDYIKKYVKGPLPAAEDRIVDEGGEFMILNYAENIIKGPFPKGEEVVAQKAGPSFEYAQYVLKGRFIKGEPAIMQDEFLKERYLDLFGPI